MCLIWRSGFLLGLHLCNPAVSSVRWTVCLEMLAAAWPRLLRMALVVILGFFFTSQTMSPASAGVTFDFPPTELMKKLFPINQGNASEQQRVFGKVEPSIFPID